MLEVATLWPKSYQRKTMSLAQVTSVTHNILLRIVRRVRKYSRKEATGYAVTTDQLYTMFIRLHKFVVEKEEPDLLE